MRKIFISISLFLFFIAGVNAQNYSRYFTDKACRVDFQFCGNDTSTTAFLERLKQEPYWGGRKAHLAGDMNLGEYRFLVTDSTSNKLIYMDGFCSLYYEWQSTTEAKSVNKSFEQSIQFPYPKHTVYVNIEKRIGFESWKSLLKFCLNPDDQLIIRTKPVEYPVKDILKSAPTDKAIDVAIIAEGYTKSEMRKFYKDATDLANNLFTHEPFKKYRDRFNFYAIGSPSKDSGVSVPQDGIWKNTAIGAHYFTFYEPRYMTSTNVYKIRDIAADVPYDAIYILTNTTTYGGGGIYNFYTLASAESTRAKAQVEVHEFGHAFAGLADEYFYDKPDALDEMYNTKVEPWEPNITTLVHFDKKWKNELPAGTPIPTPVNAKTKKLKIGVFEGGGYRSKGIYRPAYDCRMRTNKAKGFCIVCQEAIEKRILFLTDK